MFREPLQGSLEKTIGGIIEIQFTELTQSKSTVFLDKDGVIIDTVLRDKEVSSARIMSEIAFSEGADVLREPSFAQKFDFVVVSNQPDVSRGRIDDNFLLEMSRLIHAKLNINLFLYCPHTSEENCLCRKPQTGLLDHFSTKFKSIQKDDWLVGDRETDAELAERKNIHYLMMKHHYNYEQNNLNRIWIDSLSEIRDFAS